MSLYNSCKQYVGLAVLLFFFISCTSVPTIQPQVNSFVIAERFDQALKVLEDNKQGYGKNNELLFLLDRGLVLHFAGRYQESFDVLKEAKIKYEQLYTKSITKAAGSWFWNDNTKPYRGEDFERVFINIFQAVNLAAMGNIEGALVEARDVDSKLSAINLQYKAQEKNKYREDAFARLFMGLLYEASGTRSGINDALISYRKALKTYEGDYHSHYRLSAPRMLKENFLSVARYLNDEDYEYYEGQFIDIPTINFQKKQDRGVIYVVHYHGLSPQKVQDTIMLPLPGGLLSRFSFPKYQERVYNNHLVFNVVARRQDGKEYSGNTQLGQDVSSIAVKNLDDRKARIIAKSVARPVGKYFLQKAHEEQIKDHYGRGSAQAQWFRLGSNIFNLSSEQADLRSWQTLPAEIRLARLIVDPGEYSVQFARRPLGQITLKAGETRFFVVRTSR